MPNWCNNEIEISHDNPEMLERVINNAEHFLQEFIPCPKDLLEGQGWYDWQVNNWGTKWDVSLEYISLEGNTIRASFDSAWSPPIQAYKYLEEMGFKIKALYYEGGMAFCGMYKDGEDSEFNIDFESDDWGQNMPQDLIDFLEPYEANFLESIS